LHFLHLCFDGFLDHLLGGGAEVGHRRH
jgi:hypothetical protein